MKNEYTVSWPLLRQWTKEACLSGVRLVIFILYCVLGTVNLVSGITIFVISVKLGTDMLISNIALLLFITVFCFYRAFLHNMLLAKRRYKFLAKSYGCDEWSMAIEFGEDEITVSEATSSIAYKYKSITGIKEKGNKIYIKLESNAVLRLYADKFTSGSWEECKNKITEKRIA